MSSPSSLLQVRINHIDYTLSESGPFDNSNLYRVPVLRIFGISSAGQKACVHIHQVYPYFFVEYPAVINPANVNNYISRLTRSLNHALAISLKRNPESSSSQFVRAILLVKGVHFYGFHSSYAPFLKIYIVDPACINRAVTILQSGVVMKTSFCVYESHISFPLQFMCDFGLYGCGWIELSEASKRGQDQDVLNIQELETSFNVSPHPVQSRMELEVDAVAFHIINRLNISARNWHHKLTIPAPPLPSEPLVLSVRELWEDERRRRQARGLNPTPELPVDPSENSRGTGGEWVAEARWWDEIRKRIERERGKECKSPEEGWEKWVPTTFESIDGLWEDGFKAWKPPTDDSESLGTDQTSSNPFSTSSDPSLKNEPDGEDDNLSEDVDEGLLSSQQIMQLVDEVEAEWVNITGGFRDAIVDDDVGHGEDPFIHEDGTITTDFSPVKEPDISKNDPDTLYTPTSVKTSSCPQRYAELSFPRTQRKSLKRNTLSSDGWTNLSGYQSPTFHNPLATPTKTTSKSMNTSSWIPNPSRPRYITPLAFPASPTDRMVLDAARESLRSQPVSKGQTTDDVFNSSPNPSEVVTARSIDNEDPRPVKRRKIRFDSHSNIHPATPPSSWFNRPFSFPRLSQLASSTSPEGKLRSTPNPRTYIYAHLPPSSSELLLTLDDIGIPNKIYQDPYYSNEADAPERAKEYAGLLFLVQRGTGLSTLEDWNEESRTSSRSRGQFSPYTINPTGTSGLEYAGCPPSYREAQRWIQGQPKTTTIITNNSSSKVSSQIEGPTQANIYGLKTTPTGPSDSKTREKQDMTLLSLEVFAPSRPGFMPDPDVDEIISVFYSFQDANDVSTHSSPSDLYLTGMLIVEDEQFSPSRLPHLRAEIVSSELELLNRIADIVVDLDPDIVVGWEVQSASWGYLDARGKQYGHDFGQLISRAPGKRRSVGSDEWSATRTSTFAVIGRHVLNLWRVMRAEQNLETYTFENTAFHLLRQRVPRYTCDTLTAWYRSPYPDHTARALRYMMNRTTMVLQMLDAAETVTKTAEFARVFGVDFFSVISRGSQFKVESFMMRIAKAESFVLLSPSKQDVGTQNAAECMPLIMEPQSDFYNSPLVVLDFQSLYPSIMIAYNYCYSTCIGRVVDFMGQGKFGVTNLQQPPGLLETVKDHINVAPNGIIYVKPDVRKGLLGRMLKELLETRVMVKQAMKGVKGDKALRRVLDARQLGLKYISNVTYGYTSATFSGRMPAVEIADSIVQSGRETLEKAIGVIEATAKWGAKVVYGDTDSLFVYLPGKTKDQAFRIGYDISDTITAMNPAPVKLKFEKVYLPCVLLAKKRYVGFKYENPDDKEPGFDAKGIETVRRDGVLAQRKMTETCLKILFRTQDLSQVKEYCCASWSKILANKAPIQDFIFAKEVRLGTYSDRIPPPPGAMVAARRKTLDANSEPQYGDRVPYVITRGLANSKLVDRAIAPEELFDHKHRQLDGVYYITRVLIPPLERIFNLVGADVRAWYDEMPRTVRADQAESSAPPSPKKLPVEAAGLGERHKIYDHFRASQCLVCKGIACDGICGACRADPQKTIAALSARLRRIEKRLQDTHSICVSCTGSASADPIECISLDCSWLFARKKAEDKADFAVYLHKMISELEDRATLSDGDEYLDF